MADLLIKIVSSITQFIYFLLNLFFSFGIFDLYDEVAKILKRLLFGKIVQNRKNFSVAKKIVLTNLDIKLSRKCPAISFDCTTVQTKYLIGLRLTLEGGRFP